jgi:hypothetical protein
MPLVLSEHLVVHELNIPNRQLLEWAVDHKVKYPEAEAFITAYDNSLKASQDYEQALDSLDVARIALLELIKEIQ